MAVVSCENCPYRPENLSLNWDLVKVLAEDHWRYVGSVCAEFMGLCEKMYKDAFIHGYKHGVEAQKQDSSLETV
jgi:hypothetical protein